MVFLNEGSSFFNAKNFGINPCSQILYSDKILDLFFFYFCVCRGEVQKRNEDTLEKSQINITIWHLSKKKLLNKSRL